MRALAFIAALALSACASQAQPAEDMLAPVDLSTPEAAVYSMMRAMYQGDAEMVDQVFVEDAALRRVTGEGELRPDALTSWRDWVGTLEVGAAHEELFGVTSDQLGNLATVWAPFVIRFNGELVGCGVNTLTLARRDEDWRVVFGMDTGEPKETCNGFKARYLAQ
ncbi:MAG: hypothetical protein ABJH52_16240 [Henriciella sp.]